MKVPHRLIRALHQFGEVVNGWPSQVSPNPCKSEIIASNNQRMQTNTAKLLCFIGNTYLCCHGSLCRRLLPGERPVKCRWYVHMITRDSKLFVLVYWKDIWGESINSCLPSGLPMMISACTTWQSLVRPGHRRILEFQELGFQFFRDMNSPIPER